MSHLWVKDADGAWIDRPLDADFIAISTGSPAPLATREALRGEPGPVLIRNRDKHGLQRWLLLCQPESRTRVNGAPARIGVRILADRDAIVFGNGHTVFFSSERLVKTEFFPGEDDRTCCIRCKLRLEPGTPVVRCPAPECGLWHHQSDAQPCWTYTAGCAGCGHSTAFDAGFQWSPWEL